MKDPRISLLDSGGEYMTASMIEWTLEVMDWMRPRVWERWAGAEMRGSYPELGPDGYRIRFRENGRQFWVVISPEAIQETSVSDVLAALEAADWIGTLKRSGSLFVGVQRNGRPVPALRAVTSLELKVRPS